MNIDPSKCWRNRPEGDVSCTLPYGHDGPHRNVATNIAWENLGKGPCKSVGKGCGCSKDAGHDGPHQNDTTTWE